MFTEFDSYLFHEGTLYDSYKKLGAHLCTENGQDGTRFAVWAEKARSVAVDVLCNGEWKSFPMEKTQPGIWEVFVPGVKQYTSYKYLVGGADGISRWKADPYAFYSEMRPGQNSVVYGLHDYNWTDAGFLAEKSAGINDDSIVAKYNEIQETIETGRVSWLEGELNYYKEQEAELIKAQQEAIKAEKKLKKEQKAEDKKPEEKEAPKKKAVDYKAEIKKLAEKQQSISASLEEAKKICNRISSVSELSEEEQHNLANRIAAGSSREKPMAIYEVHLGSWKKDFRLNKEGFLNYRALADQLSDYVEYMGFTHVELMGICEYPFDGSWGYQVTGYFSPTSRHGNPDDLKYFIDRMHSKGIGVIVDWVPAHFPKDVFGMENFDGTPMYESEDRLLAEYPEWGTKAFDYSKPEVRNFMISSALYWIREFHADALRVDAVAAMLFTNFSRAEYRPNKYGGNENLESIAFLKQLNDEVINRTGAFLIAEDSSEVQRITRPVYDGGIGFMYKWNMGWMNDTINYFKKDPIYRKYHFDALTHTTDYVYSEYFINVLSHDEVVHLKKPMLYKMPGAVPDKLSGLKTLYTYQFVHPGKKLLFMGQEFAEDREWDENREINWSYANDKWHRDVLLCVQSLLKIYREHPVLYKDSLNEKTIEWVNRNDADRGIMAFIRKNPEDYNGALLVILNTTPVQYNAYSCGIPKGGFHKCIFSTYDSTPDAGRSEDAPPLTASMEMCDWYEYKISYDLRPFEAVIIEV